MSALDAPATDDDRPRICGRREYVGDGIYYVCRRPKGHVNGHDYGWGIGRGARPGGLA